VIDTSICHSRKKNLTRFYSTKLRSGSSSARDTCFHVTLTFADYERSEVGRELTIKCFFNF
jgi:hypothetical protein